MRSRLVLYATDHCTLCDTALDMLLGAPGLQGMTLDVIDVATDDALCQRYGDRLPVLLVGDRELDWPFSAEDVPAILDKR